MPEWSHWVERWQSAGLLEPEAAARIRSFECSAAPAHRFRWWITLPFVFGGLLLGAGVFLFVSSHWDELSPTFRISLVLGALGLFHLGAVFTAGTFPVLATTLHAVGTLALGGAIALTGQIFNLQEHWPSGILLWAMGAGTGWWLLKAWPQFALFALLAPAWFGSEWTFSIEPNGGRFLDSFALMLAIAYMSAWREQDDNHPRCALGWLGGLALLICAAGVAVGVDYRGAPVRTTAVLLAYGLPLAVMMLLRRGYRMEHFIAVAWVAGLEALSGHSVPIPVYLWCILGATLMVAWGVRDSRPERINLGIAGFAITVGTFYFSSVMDKLGRAASLVGLGLLFLVGSWALERLRRRLLAQVPMEAK